MYYIDKPRKIKRGWTCHLIWYAAGEFIHYQHNLQDFALSGLDLPPCYEQRKGSHLEHYDLFGMAIIKKALRLGVWQLTNFEYRNILRKKRKQVVYEPKLAQR